MRIYSILFKYKMKALKKNMKKQHFTESFAKYAAY